MKARARPCAAGVVLALSTGSVMAAPHIAVGAADIVLGLLAVCWVGFPMLLLLALVCQVIRSFIASLRRPLPVIRAPDTDLMASCWD